MPVGCIPRGPIGRHVLCLHLDENETRNALLSTVTETYTNSLDTISVALSLKYVRLPPI